MGVLVDGLAAALGGAVAAGPVRPVVLQLQHAVVVLVAQHAAVLADPLHAALLAVVKIGSFGLLPSVREAKHVDLYRNALHPDPLAAQHAHLLLQAAQLAVDDEGAGDAALDLGVHLRADVFEEGEYGGERGDGGHFDGGLEELLVGQRHFYLCGERDDLWGYDWTG